ncbi:MAG TPA: glycosyltransferase [Dehalococcoidia bacterium]|nr:glycosyltransferase [Dehalococcoidia bacterium]
MDVTCVICTFRRPEPLADALRSAVAQTLTPSLFEVLVVDNASDPATEAAVHELSASNLRYVREPNLGLSNARNRGLREARGRLVAFMDDDAVAEPAWLEALLASFATGPQPMAVGGPVRGLWEAERPRWLRGHLLTFLSLLDYGALPKECSLPEEPLFGCNFAVGRDVALELGGFRAILGRSGGRLLSAEEIDFQVRLLRAGGHVLYEPAAVVGHRVPAERMTRRWFLRRVYAQGISDALVTRTSGGSGVSGELRPPLRYRLKRAMRSPSLTLVALGAAYAVGFARGAAASLGRVPDPGAP